ncbi:MAG TPA: hypothetical protein DEG69_02060 [Flavobacteriaceae bacterium]|nr:hypothetical protein [Flavobacteriaceae bacterium]
MDIFQNYGNIPNTKNYFTCTREQIVGYLIPKLSQGIMGNNWFDYLRVFLVTVMINPPPNLPFFFVLKSLIFHPKVT